MESRKSTPEEIESILQSIDDISRAGMPPFFYTRLQAKLANGSAIHTPFWMVITKPAVSLVTLSLLVILNVAAIRYYMRSSKQNSTGESVTGIQKFAQDYDLDASSVYINKTANQ